MGTFLFEYLLPTNEHSSPINEHLVPTNEHLSPETESIEGSGLPITRSALANQTVRRSASTNHPMGDTVTQSAPANQNRHTISFSQLEPSYLIFTRSDSANQNGHRISSSQSEPPHLIFRTKAETGNRKHSCHACLATSSMVMRWRDGGTPHKTCQNGERCSPPLVADDRFQLQSAALVFVSVTSFER